MRKSEFLVVLLHLFNIDVLRLPELTAKQRKDFLADRAQFFLSVSGVARDAIWREVENRSKLSDADIICDLLNKAIAKARAA